MSPGVQPPPEFLIDRSLGVALREAIAALNYTVHTLRSMYGEEEAQNVDDEVWIPRFAQLGYILLTKDDEIRRYPPARDAAFNSAAKIFCLPSANMTGDRQNERFITNLNRIIQRSRHNGPYMYAVDTDGLRLLWPK